MGLIRKSLAVGSAGVVRPESKKQRTARRTAESAAEVAAHAQRQAASSQAQVKADAADKRYQYETDPQYRAWADQELAGAAAIEQRRRERRDAETQRRAALPWWRRLFDRG